MATPLSIRVIAICIVKRGDELLVFEGFDAVKSTHYYRPPGGGVEPGERAADAAKREFREELNTSIRDLRQIHVCENIFTLDGVAKHEVVFVFDGELTDRSIYARDVIDTFEHDGTPMRVLWRRLDKFDETHRLVPEGILSIASFPPPVPHEFSRRVNMWLELDDGSTLDVRQCGGDFLMLPDDVPSFGPITATLVVSLDDRPDRCRVRFTDGIDPSRSEQPIEHLSLIEYE